MGFVGRGRSLGTEEEQGEGCWIGFERVVGMRMAMARRVGMVSFMLCIYALVSYNFLILYPLYRHELLYLISIMWLVF